MRKVAAILSGLCPKSSITLTPFALADQLEAAAQAREAGQRRGGLGERHADRLGRGDRGERILGIVAAGHLQAHRHGRRRVALKEIANGASARSRAEQVGASSLKRIGAEPLGRQHRGEQAGLVVVEVEHDRLGLGGEIAEQVAELVERLVVEA